MEQRRVDPATLDLLPEAVVVLDRDGIVVVANDRAQALLGIGPGVFGRPLNTLLDVVDETGAPSSLPPPIPRVGRRMAECVLILRCADGRTRPIAISGRVTDDAWILSVRLAGRREAMDRVHGDVVATVSHEIRSPLTSVKGFTRTLITRWDKFSDEQKLVMLATIDADADRVMRLLRDLLEVSRIDARRVTLRRSRVDIGELVASVVARASHREDAAGRELRFVAPTDCSELDADRGRIEQALSNLIDNALRHAPEGPITVAVDRAAGPPPSDAPAGVDGERGVGITVTDVGPGVAEELRHVIFQKFARGRGSQQPGTGLGLYITRGLVRAHGGCIELDDTAVGASFRIWLPLPSGQSVRS